MEKHLLRVVRFQPSWQVLSLRCFRECNETKTSKPGTNMNKYGPILYHHGHGPLVDGGHSVAQSFWI